jgi:hypothetical protein
MLAFLSLAGYCRMSRHIENQVSDQKKKLTNSFTASLPSLFWCPIFYGMKISISDVDVHLGATFGSRLPSRFRLYRRVSMCPNTMDFTSICIINNTHKVEYIYGIIYTRVPFLKWKTIGLPIDVKLLTK